MLKHLLGGKTLGEFLGVLGVPGSRGGGGSLCTVPKAPGIESIRREGGNAPSLSSFFVSFCFLTGHLVWMLCQQSSDNELLELEKSNCVQYRRHFLVDNSPFHGELPFSAPVVRSFVSHSTLFQHSGCKCGIIIGLNQELELTH